MSRTSAIPTPPPTGGTTLFLVGLGLALLAAGLSAWYLTDVAREKEGESFTVYRLTTSVKPPHALQDNDVVAVQMPQKYADAFASYVRGEDLAARRGNPFRRPAKQNEFLSYDHFADPMATADMPEPVTEARHVSLPVNARSLPATLQPGAYVDLAAPFTVPGGNGLPEMMTVLERVRIVAIGQQVMMSEDSAALTTGVQRLRGVDSITIEVDPRVALHLSKVRRIQAGDFDVYQRAANDTGVTFTGVNPDLLSGLEAGTVTSGGKRR